MFDFLPAVDIVAFLRTAAVISLLTAVWNVWSGYRAITRSQNMPYFRLRRQRLQRGWWRLVYAVGFFLLSAFLVVYGEPVAMRVLPLTPTASLTPTITVSPTITLTPTITLSPTTSPTPATSPTAQIPQAIEALFESEVTPNPDTVFSDLLFSQRLDSLFRPISPGEIFQNPVGQMYASFTYDAMALGSQWTAVWYRDGELVHFETLPWADGTGGAGFSEWQPDPAEWVPGNYQVVIFVGTEWRQVGNFVVQGFPITATATQTSVPTPTTTLTNTPVTPFVSPTFTLSPTPFPTLTRTPTQPTPTPFPTLTRTITPTTWPTLTRTPTPTP